MGLALAVPAMIAGLLNSVSSGNGTCNAIESEAMQQEIARYREQHAELIARFNALKEELRTRSITSFDSLSQHYVRGRQALIELSNSTGALRMLGKNIALFGITSTGKSTMLNALLGQNVAATGPGETTTEIKPYRGRQYTLWDIPGRNDETSYLTMEYISFFKGLSRRVILITSTLKENSSIMKLLDEIELTYDIVFNKFDLLNENDQNQIKQQIRSEVNTLGLRRVGKIYFVSAKNPRMFPDWLSMVNDFTN